MVMHVNRCQGRCLQQHLNFIWRGVEEDRDDSLVCLFVSLANNVGKMLTECFSDEQQDDAALIDTCGDTLCPVGSRWRVRVDTHPSRLQINLHLPDHVSR